MTSCIESEDSKVEFYTRITAKEIPSPDGVPNCANHTPIVQQLTRLNGQLITTLRVSDNEVWCHIYGNPKESFKTLAFLKTVYRNWETVSYSHSSMNNVVIFRYSMPIE